MKNLFFILIFTISFLACSGDSPDKPNTGIVKDPNPRFEIDREIVYFGEYHGYADVFKPYYYQYSIKQTNPNAMVSQERLKEMEDSLNNIIEFSNKGNTRHLFFLPNVGIEVNGEPLDMFMQLNVGENNREEYISLGRDGLIDIWRNNKMLNLFVSEGRDISFRMRTVTDDLHMSFKADKNMNDYVDSDYFKLVDKKMSEKTDYEPIAFYWVYDRFNDRVYVDDEGNNYSTKIVVKTMKEVEGYDHSIVAIPEWVQFIFELDVLYPVIQIYKNDELWFEGRILRYYEEHEELEDGMDTIIGFYACTKRDGCCWQLIYEWAGYSRIHIEKYDCTKPTDTDKFTEVGTVNVKIIEDKKDGHKGTGSFDDGKGNTFNFNAAY